MFLCLPPPGFVPGGGFVSREKPLAFCRPSCYDHCMPTTTVTSSQLMAAADAADTDYDAVRADYSGRGMFGERCVGFVGTDAEAAVFGFVLAAEILAARRSDPFEHVVAADLIHDLTDVVRRLVPSTDSMGRSTIYYWSNVSLADGEIWTGDEY